MINQQMNKKVERSLIFQQFSVEDAAVFFVEKISVGRRLLKNEKRKEFGATFRSCV